MKLMYFQNNDYNITKWIVDSLSTTFLTGLEDLSHIAAHLEEVCGCLADTLFYTICLRAQLRVSSPVKTYRLLKTIKFLQENLFTSCYKF